MAPAKRSTKSTAKTAGKKSSGKKTSTSKTQSILTGSVTKAKPLTLKKTPRKKGRAGKNGLPFGVALIASNIPQDESDPQIQMLDHDNLPDVVPVSTLYPTVVPPLDTAIRTYLDNPKRSKYMLTLRFSYPPFDSMAIKFFISFLKNPSTATPMPMPTIPLTLHIFEFALTFATTNFLDLTSGFVITQVSELGQECLEKGVTSDSKLLWRLLVNSLFTAIPATATKEGKAALADVQEAVVTSLAPHLRTLLHDPPTDNQGKGKGKAKGKGRVKNKNKDAEWPIFLEKEHPGLAIRLLVEVTKQKDEEEEDEEEEDEEDDEDEDEDEDVDLEEEGDEGVDLTEAAVEEGDEGVDLMEDVEEH